MLKQKTFRGRQNKRPSRSVKVPEAIRHIEHALKARDFGRLDVVRFPGTGFPDELRCVLKYSTTYNTSGSVTPSPYVFRLNSLFDPDLTGTGHQPFFFDQLTAVYGQYCVTAGKARVGIENQQSAVALKVVALYSDSNVSSLAVDTLCETKFAKECVVAETSAGPNVKTINMPTVSISQLQGQKDLRDDPSNYTSISTNPVDPVFFIVKYTAMDAVTTTAATVSVTLWFDCTFKELIPPGSSLEEYENAKCESSESSKDSPEESFDKIDQVGFSKILPPVRQVDNGKVPSTCARTTVHVRKF